MPDITPYVYKATVISVHDGDTMTLNLNLGFEVQFKLVVRLMGIDTPELSGKTKAAAIRSRDRLRDLVAGGAVTVRTFKDSQEKYGRYLADVYVPGVEKSVNQILVDEGLAVPYFGGRKQA